MALHAQTPTRRLQSADLQYVGAFRLPRTNDEFTTYAYGGTGISYRASTNALAVVAHDWHQWIGEVTVPTPSTASTVSALPTAAPRVVPRDLLAGKIGLVNPSSPNAKKIGGTYPLPDGGWLVTAYDAYDGGGSSDKSHFRVSASGAVTGPFLVGNAGFTAGWMLPIPAEWQSALGAPALTGVCCLSVIGRTSVGPTVTTFDPARDAQSGTMVLGYPLDHATLGKPEAPTSLYTMSTLIRGAVFPSGTASILFFGVDGTSSCYGGGTADRSLVGKKAADGVVWCYDPVNTSKGNHGYPYVSRVWAYDANDLVAVKQGRKQPWEVLPYTTWTFDLPFESANRGIMGAAYDAATGRIFLTGQYGDSDGYPLVHVLSVAGSTQTPPPTPVPEPTPEPQPQPEPEPTPPPQPPPSAPAGWTLAWTDEFDGTALDTSKWTAVTNCGDKRNNELQCYMAANVRVSGGSLVLTLQRQSRSGFSYTSGAVKTGTKFRVSPGMRVEFRAKMPAGGDGIWPALWLYPTNQWPPEIDVLETVEDQHTVYQTYHWGTEQNHQQDSGGTSMPTPSDWHVYAIEWTANQIRWLIDDRVTKSHTGSDVTSIPMQLYANLSCGGSWPGNSCGAALPQTLQLDYVRVYRAGGSTPPPPPATPVDAVVSAWSDWQTTTCTETRVETHTRSVITPAQNGGSTPPLTETRTTTGACQ
jgi:beta-glucanase (GH16 family)